MGCDDIIALDATTLRAQFAAKRFSVRDVAEAYLARVGKRNQAVLAWTALDPDFVLREADRLDTLAVQGPLHGLPLAVKDVFDTRDLPTTFGSPLYAGHQPALDAPSVEILRAAGALLFGKTATVEFAAMGHKPPTKNPHDPAHSPGGTSSGSAAAVADWQVALALGTQTAGSTIRPASFCGVHAFKPTWNLVSREGVKFFSVSIDTVTWFARSVADLKLVFDQYDVLGLPEPAHKPVSQLRIGVYRTAYWDSAAPAVQVAFDAAIDALGAQGAKCEVFAPPPFFTELNQAQAVVVMTEGRMSLLNDWRTHGAEMHPDFARYFFAGTPVDPDRLRAAFDLAAQARKIFDVLARPFDVVLAPSAADVAPLGLDNTGNPAFNQLWSLLQVPCVNIPLPVAGLPIGVTATGPRYADRAVLAAAQTVDRALRP